MRVYNKLRQSRNVYFSTLAKSVFIIGVLLAFRKPTHAKQKHRISCPYGQLIYIIIVKGLKVPQGTA
ncbi:hypothetical protein A6281_25430 [Bacillus wiedmannii]|nr:hypothetical protein A6281_25430 [Bacillus wiedmannii]OAK23303.1 hypothetical protein A6282_25535 [Bacillus wiedmannii]